MIRNRFPRRARHAASVLLTGAVMLLAPANFGAAELRAEDVSPVCDRIFKTCNQVLGQLNEAIQHAPPEGYATLADVMQRTFDRCLAELQEEGCI